MELVFSFFSNYLIEFMTACLCVGLVFRYAAYRASKSDNAYYSAFTRELELHVERDKEGGTHVEDVDRYLSNILGRVGKGLPQRSLRGGSRQKEEESQGDGVKTLSLREYVSGRNGLISNIQAESSVFHNQTPPNFTELTHRIMDQDPHWTKVWKYFPIDNISRMIDMLPGTFVVLGVFGTFIGISMALPEIAKIDFNDLDGSTATLMSFVLNVTYAMKTSVAGIFFSLVLNVLNTFSPIKETRRRVFKKVETSLQMLWYHIQQDVHAEQNHEQVFVKLLSVLEKMEAKLDQLPSSDNSDSDKKAS